jgi:hypothetical protein
LGKVCFAELLSVVGTSRPIERPGHPEAQLVIRESAGPPPGARATLRTKKNLVPRRL